MKKSKKILIVGGTGFIGYHLAKKCLRKKWHVVSFSKNKPRKERRLKKINYLTGDLSNLKDLKKINQKYDYVVNLGGYVDHSNKTKPYNSHFIGCKNLAKIFLKKEIKSFVQVGSSGEYGKFKSPQIELTGGNPKSIYARSKFLASNYLLNKFKKKKFPVTILRLYQAYGPGQDINRFIPIVIDACLRNKKFDCSDGKQLRDFIYIDDVINVILKSLSSRKSKGEVFNIGTGKPKKIKNIINYLTKKLRGGKPIFGKIKLRKDEILKIYPDISKAKKVLKWYPKTNFNKGLLKTIRYYKRN